MVSFPKAAVHFAIPVLCSTAVLDQCISD